MPDTSAVLLERLSHNSAAYRDPLTHIDWRQFDSERVWLPESALSLCEVPEFAALPDATRRRIAQHEFANVMLCGLWLESVFLQRLSRRLGPALPRGEYEYLLHELREEAGHSLMFLRTIEAGELALPPGAWQAPRLADFVARHSPVDGALFWLAVVIAEDVPDKFNRRLRQYGDELHRGVRQVCTLHLIDEARHITYARSRLEELLQQCGAVSRAGLSVAARLLLRQLAAVFYFPPARYYELAGLNDGAAWRRRALQNPARQRFVRQCLAPTLRLLRSSGLLSDPATRAPSRSVHE
ncbi:MAG: diiron oxygenase [Betaproteobacteria bacterium]